MNKQNKGNPENHAKRLTEQLVKLRDHLTEVGNNNELLLAAEKARCDKFIKERDQAVNNLGAWKTANENIADRLKDAVDFLKTIQWSEPSVELPIGDHQCRHCFAEEREGHADHCPLGYILEQNK